MGESPQRGRVAAAKPAARTRSGKRPIVVYTVGHSTRPIDAFIALLAAHEVDCLADVRTVPKSRHNPQFAGDALAASLAAAGIDYRPFPGLGGFRRASADSPNAGWRNASFRGYADYMETTAFRESLDRLRAQAVEARTAIMCAEAPWWRCHRALIADALKAQGMQVLHIVDRGKVLEHPYTSAACVVADKVYYGPVGDLLDTRSNP